MDGIGKELCDLQPTCREAGAQGRRRGWGILCLATGSACGHASRLANSDSRPVVGRGHVSPLTDSDPRPVAWDVGTRHY